MNLSKMRNEHGLYLGIFLLALAVRLVGLGEFPLNNTEASLALQALDLTRGQAPALSPQPAYLAFTSALMFLLGSGNWVARAWPAIAGSLLALAPMLFSGRIGKPQAVLTSFFLALDPVMLSISRQAGSQTTALLFTLLALGLWLQARPLAAGVFGGLALLGGPAVWPGIVGLGIAVWAGSAGQRKDVASDGEAATFPPGGSRFRTAGFAALAAVLLGGTLFFTTPTGISAAAASLPAYLGGWASPANFPVYLFLVSLVLYELFPLLLGLWGGVRGLLRGETIDRLLVYWWAAAFLLGLIYPGRGVADLAWMVLPLWVLAARQLVHLLRVPVEDRLPLLGQVLLSAIILSFLSLTAVTFFNNSAFPQQEIWIRVIGAGILLVASTGLVAWGWSGKIALRGLVFGASLVLLAYMVSASWDAAGFSDNQGRALLSGGEALPGEALLMGTVEDLNQWGPVETGGLDVVVVDTPSPALRWMLRDVERVTFVDLLPQDASPALVITPAEPELSLAATYRGQGFLLSQNANWGQFALNDWFRWLVFRTVPASALAQDKVILWARLDLFPADSSTASNLESPR